MDHSFGKKSVSMTVSMAVIPECLKIDPLVICHNSVCIFLPGVILTLVLLNKLRCHALSKFSANQIN